MHITVYFRRGKKAPFIAFLCIALILCILVPILFSRCYFTPSRPDTTQVYGVPLYQMLMKEGSAGRPGTHRTVRYIVIHETANTNPGADAQAHAGLLQSGQNGTTSWHYSVDDHEICQSIPDDEIAYHAGDKRKEGGGNACGIGIELCVNQDGDFEKTFPNGAKLTAFLLQEYHLGIGAVKQHADFMEKNCPSTIRDQGRWPEFLQLVEQYMQSSES